MPYAWFSFDVEAPPEVVADRLRAATGPPGSRALPLRGHVEHGHFEVERAIHHRNSFLPRMVGAIEPTAAGSQVRVTMTLRWGVLALMAASFGLWAFIGVVGSKVQSRTGPDEGFAVVMSSIPAVALSLALVGFYGEFGPSGRAVEQAARG